MRQGSVLKIQLFPESEAEFFSKFPEVQYVFVKDEKGSVTHLRIRQGDEETTAKKIK